MEARKESFKSVQAIRLHNLWRKEVKENNKTRKTEEVEKERKEEGAAIYTDIESNIFSNYTVVLNEKSELAAGEINS